MYSVMVPCLFTLWAVEVSSQLAHSRHTVSDDAISGGRVWRFMLAYFLPATTSARETDIQLESRLTLDSPGIV